MQKSIWNLLSQILFRFDSLITSIIGSEVDFGGEELTEDFLHNNNDVIRQKSNSTKDDKFDIKIYLLINI